MDKEVIVNRFRAVGISEAIGNSQDVTKKVESRFFYIWVLFHDHSPITGLQEKGEGISLTSLYHFHPLHRHRDISRAITVESSPLHIDSSQTQTGNLWFPSATR